MTESSCYSDDDNPKKLDSTETWWDCPPDDAEHSDTTPAQPGPPQEPPIPRRESSSSPESSPSPIYYRGCFKNGKHTQDLKLKFRCASAEQDPLQSKPEESNPADPDQRDCEENGEGVLDVSLKTREPAQRKDLDHLIGALAKEMVLIKRKTGFMPRYKCSGTKFSGRNVMFKFPDAESMEFYKKTIRCLAGPSENHGGYYVRGAGDPPPFRKYRAWIPGEMMEVMESIPDFLAMETDDQINGGSLKIVGSSPSSSNGYMVYFEVTTKAEAYVRTFPSGIMCGAHKLKFSQVNENKTLKAKPPAKTRTPSPCSSAENWRFTPSPIEGEASCHTPRSPVVFYRPNRSPFLSTVEESRSGGEERRNSAPDVIQTQPDS